MSYDINTCTLIGRLTRDIELRKAPSGLAVGKISIANNTTGDKEKVSFFDCYLFGEFADKMGQYLTKGKQIAIIGRLNQDRWVNSEGQNRSSVKIIIDKLSLLNSGSGGSNNNNSYSDSTSPPETKPDPKPAEPEEYKGTDSDLDPNDNIPF